MEIPRDIKDYLKTRGAVLVVVGSFIAGGVLGNDLEADPASTLEQVPAQTSGSPETTETESGFQENSPAWMPEEITRWDPVVEAVAEAYNENPNLFRVLIMLETYGIPQRTSPSNAECLTQIWDQSQPALAARLGLKIWNMDNPWVCLSMAAEHIQRTREKFNITETEVSDVFKLLMAYNGGDGRTEQFIDGDTSQIKPETVEYATRAMYLWEDLDQPDSPTAEWLRGAHLAAVEVDPYSEERYSQYFDDGIETHIPRFRD